MSPLGRLDLHHVGTEVGQQQRAVRARDHGGEVDDAHALEGETGHRRIIGVPLEASAPLRPSHSPRRLGCFS